MKVHRIFAGFIVVAATVFSCSVKDNNSNNNGGVVDCGPGPGPSDTEFTVTDYSVRFEHIVSGEIITSIDPLDFVIRLESESVYSVREALNQFTYNFSWFPSAYACSYAVEQIPAQELIGFSITSTGSFGEEYQPGVDLTRLFLALEATPSRGDHYQVDDVPKTRKMLLRNAPIDEEHIFTISVELDDGLIFEQNSEVITFVLD